MYIIYIRDHGMNLSNNTMYKENDIISPDYVMNGLNNNIPNVSPSHRIESKKNTQQ
jgi:hypothetical protein